MNLPKYTSRIIISVKAEQVVDYLTLRVTEYNDIGKGDCHYVATVYSTRDNSAKTKKFSSYEDATAHLSHYIF